MNIETVDQFDTVLSKGPYAWPGGYPLYFITDDGCPLSFDSAKQNAVYIRDSIERRLTDGWRVVAVEVNWEDPQLYCDDLGIRIPSAYAEDSTQED